MSLSISSNEVKSVKSLGQKKYRDSLGMFVVEGEKMVAEALGSPFEVVKVYRVEEIGIAAMGRLSLLSSPSPALAVVRKPSGVEIGDMDSYSLPDKGLFLALDGIRDPGNLGTIVRIAGWFGIDAVFASEDTVDIFNPKVVQATMGAIFRVKFHYCDIPSLCRAANGRGGYAYGTFLDGEDIYSSPLRTGEAGPSVIVVGNESNGISKRTAEAVAGRLYIPPYPQGGRGAESLNAAAATAVAVAEFRRRARACPPPPRGTVEEQEGRTEKC